MSGKLLVVQQVNFPELPRRRLSWLSTAVQQLPWSLALGLLLSLTANAVAQPANPIDAMLPLEALSTPTDDLIRLTESYTDAVRDLKIAKLNIDTVQRLKPNAIVTNLEVQIAMLNLEAAQRKRDILRAVVEKQLAATENKLEIMTYLESLGAANAQMPRMPNGKNFARAQDEATIRILRMILAVE